MFSEQKGGDFYHKQLLIQCFWNGSKWVSNLRKRSRETNPPSESSTQRDGKEKRKEKWQNWTVLGREGRIKTSVPQDYRDDERKHKSSNFFFFLNNKIILKKKNSILSSSNENMISHQSKAKQTAYAPAQLRDTFFLPAKLESQMNLFWV